MTHYVYILYSEKDGNFYTGRTTTLQKRLSEHRIGINTSTKNRRPLSLIYYEACGHLMDAVRREKYLKTGMGKRYLRNRLKEALSRVRK